MARRRATPAPVAVQTGQGVAELVADGGGGRVLYLGGLPSAHVDLDDPATLRMDYLARMARALDALVPRGRPADVLHLGGGAFALPRFLAATRPLVRQEVYELEPALVALAREHLGLRRTASLTVKVGDAAVFLARREGASADVVVCDAFVGTEIPPALVAGADVVHRVLRPDGLYFVNVIDAPPWPASRAVLAALRPHFDTAVTFGAREVVRGKRAGNVLVAAGAAVRIVALERALAGGAFPSEVRVAFGA